MNATEASVEFLHFLSAERAVAKNTLLAYEKDLEQFAFFCSTRQIGPQQATLKHLREFLATLRKQGLAPRSLARKMSALKQFFQFLLREGHIEANPSELLSITVKSKRLPKHLSIEEIFRLIAAARGDTPNEIRDRALLEFWYATGARVTELATLEAAAIDWKAGMVRFTGKGGRERWVPLHAEALAWGLRYKTLRHDWMRLRGLPETEAFFLSRQSQAFTRQGLWKILKKYVKRAGIQRKVWPHMIRHSFATHVLRGGADLRAVQELLGHRSISTTEVYTHLDIENLKVMQQKYHPRD